MFIVSERFLSDVMEEYGAHPVSIDDGETWLSSSGL